MLFLHHNTVEHTNQQPICDGIYLRVKKENGHPKMSVSFLVGEAGLDLHSRPGMDETIHYKATYSVYTPRLFGGRGET